MDQETRERLCARISTLGNEVAAEGYAAGDRDILAIASCVMAVAIVCKLEAEHPLEAALYAIRNRTFAAYAQEHPDERRDA